MVRSHMPFYALAGFLLTFSTAYGQVSVRAPFVRVDVGPPGGGVRVQAPFVNVNVPPSYPAYYPIVRQPIAYPPQGVAPQQPAPYVLPPQPVNPQQPQNVVPQQPTPYQPKYQPVVPPVQQGEQLNPPRIQNDQVQLYEQLQPAPVQQSQGPVEIPAPNVYQGPVVNNVLVKTRPMTHYEFARAFVPCAGKYEVVLVHPGCCEKIVKVCFDLPPGTPRVDVGNRYIEYDYGYCQVEIRFALFGNVRVEYHN